LAKFTSQESGIEHPCPALHSRTASSRRRYIESFKTVRIGEQRESKCVNTHCDRSFKVLRGPVDSSEVELAYPTVEPPKTGFESESQPFPISAKGIGSCLGRGAVRRRFLSTEYLRCGSKIEDYSLGETDTSGLRKPKPLPATYLPPT